MRCERCGRDNQGLVTFCLGCGTRLGHGTAVPAVAEPSVDGPPAVCERCHQPNRPTYRFCLSCGNPLGEGGAGQGPGAPPDPSVIGAPRPTTIGTAPPPRNGAPPASMTLASMQASHADPPPPSSEEARPLAAMPVIHLGPRENSPPPRSSPPPAPAPPSPAHSSSPPAPGSPLLARGSSPAAPNAASPPAPTGPAPARTSSPSLGAAPPARTSSPSLGAASPARTSSPPLGAAPPARTSSPPLGAAPPEHAPSPPPGVATPLPTAAPSAPPPAAPLATSTPPPARGPSPSQVTKASAAPARAPTPRPALQPLPGSDAEAFEEPAARCPRCQSPAAFGQLFCRSCGFALDLAPGADATTKALASFFSAPAPAAGPAAGEPGDDVLATVVNASRPLLDDDDDGDDGDDDEALWSEPAAEGGGEGAEGEPLAPRELALDDLGPSHAAAGPHADEADDTTALIPGKLVAMAFAQAEISVDGLGDAPAPSLVHRRPTVNVSISHQALGESSTRRVEPPVTTAPHGRLLIYTHDSAEGAPFDLIGSPCDIGSREGAVRLADDPYVSPLHARLELEGGGWHMVDLNSVNGVYRRLCPSVELVDGDLILLGQQVLRFELVMDAERSLRPAYQHGVALFGTPALARHARLCQRTVEGVTRDVVHMGRDELILGREGADLSFPEDGFLSRRHAAVRRDAVSGRFTLDDLGSSNGTFVALRGRSPARDGDVFRIGLHLLRLETSSGAAGGGEGAGGRGGSA